MGMFYNLRSGKNSKLKFYAINFFRLIYPRFICRARLKHLLKNTRKRADYPYIRQRVDYCNKLSSPVLLPEGSHTLKEHRYFNKEYKNASVYFFDSYEYTRWFPQHLMWNYHFGDITFIPEVPSIVKSRPVAGDNANSVIMKLNKIRHYIFVNDVIPFSEKKDMLIFRGKFSRKPKRKHFMEMYFGHPMCDLGHTGRNPDFPAIWNTPKMTIQEQLKYKFILALEGNDVASNLKWVMSSNSIAVMPEPEFETWYMEGTLIPDYHYIRIKPDYSDLEERLRYYIKHEEEALEIIRHANEYTLQFRNCKREKLISLLILQKYFEATRQLSDVK